MPFSTPSALLATALFNLGSELQLWISFKGPHLDVIHDLNVLILDLICPVGGAVYSSALLGLMALMSSCHFWQVCTSGDCNYTRTNQPHLHYSKLIGNDEGWNIDSLVDQELCLWAQFQKLLKLIQETLKCHVSFMFSELFLIVLHLSGAYYIIFSHPPLHLQRFTDISQLFTSDSTPDNHIRTIVDVLIF